VAADERVAERQRRDEPARLRREALRRDARVDPHDPVGEAREALHLAPDERRVAALPAVGQDHDDRAARQPAPPVAIVELLQRVAAKGFAPKAGGLVAALPFCDALVSGHTLKALEEVADAIAAERDYDPLLASWRVPTLNDEPEEETWGVAGTTERHVAMPSGYGAYKGNTSPGSNSGL
jgi:hypothetical protein